MFRIDAACIQEFRKLVVLVQGLYRRWEREVGEEEKADGVLFSQNSCDDSKNVTLSDSPVRSALFIRSPTHSGHKYLLRTYKTPGTVQGPGETRVATAACFLASQG